MTPLKATLNITIDNTPYRVREGVTILEAAQQNDIYIPSLCAHKDLSPYGGCRMCIVEVEGVRNFPTACTTPVTDGMVVRTKTKQIESIRMDILQLFMSEHTSSCLICEERAECKDYMKTIRKVGVTTGCRYCPSDGQCELQTVAEKLQVEDIKYPIYYRGLRVEKEDPFYDRDYNLCILCGRCVRVCQEIRTANVLAFNQRGRNTVIGPAYERTHIEAGCEFCGDCVSVCPVGALSEKTNKWDGRPDREEITTCAYCGVGCNARLLVKDDRIIGSLPAEESPVNNGQLCVKGRFCVTEFVNTHHRLTRPTRMDNGTGVQITWDEAAELAAKKLADCPPDRFGLLISPNCSNEDLYIAQKFTRVAMASHNIDTSARGFYGSGFNAYLDLLKIGAPLAEVQKADIVLCVGLDTRYGRSVVGVEIRKAIKNGARIITVNAREHSLSLRAEHWLQPSPGAELDVLQSLVKLTGREKVSRANDQLRQVGEVLGKARSPVILLGSELLQYDNSAAILETLARLARNIKAKVLPLPAQNNLAGSLIMGAYSELLPGGNPTADKKKLAKLQKAWGVKLPSYPLEWNACDMTAERHPKLLYLIGETIPKADFSPEFLIWQNLYPPSDATAPDLFLPSAAFTEVDGTYINGGGRVQRVRKTVPALGDALPDWQILCRIAQKMGKSGFDFSDASQVHQEIASLVDGFAGYDGGHRLAASLACEGEIVVKQRKPRGKPRTDKEFPFVLQVAMNEHTHRGFPLAKRVEGARRLFPEGIVEINPEDACRAGISEGDKLVVTATGFKQTWPATISDIQPPGTLHVVLPHGESIRPNPCPVKLRKCDV